jgi:hypothetical protein
VRRRVQRERLVFWRQWGALAVYCNNGTVPTVRPRRNSVVRTDAVWDRRTPRNIHRRQGVCGVDTGQHGVVARSLIKRF